MYMYMYMVMVTYMYMFVRGRVPRPKVEGEKSQYLAFLNADKRKARQRHINGVVSKNNKYNMFGFWRDKAALLIRPGLIRPGLCSPKRGAAGLSRPVSAMSCRPRFSPSVRKHLKKYETQKSTMKTHDSCDAARPASESRHRDTKPGIRQRQI